MMMDAALMSWATLIPANIKLSVLKPSTKNLPAEYNIKYRPIICPWLAFLCFLNHIKNRNMQKSMIDSYRNVG